MADKLDYVPPHDGAHWYSMGRACSMMQVTPGQLRVLMDDVGVNFRMLIDDVGYVRGDDMLTIANRCGELRREIADAVDKVANAPSN